MRFPIALRLSGALLTTTTFVMAAAAPAIAEPLELQVGGAVTVSPKYEGSKEYEVRGFPIVAPAATAGADDGLVQFRGVDDIRLRALRFNGFEAGPLAGYRFTRDEDDADRLEGLGDVDGGLVIGAYAAYNLGGIKPFVSYHYGVTGDDTGGLLRFGAETKVPLALGISVTAVAGATYADSDYMESYFGVSGIQSFNSVANLGVYETDAGIKDVYLGLSTDIPLTDVWSLKIGGRYSHLVGDASDSPIVETDSQFSALLGLTYKFSIDR